MYLLTQSGPDTSGGPMADGVHGINAWCSRSVVVVTDQEQLPLSTMLPVQDGTGMEICSANCTCGLHM